MKISNGIGWCDATSNGVTGCDKVSPGCKNCYAQIGTRARVLRAQGIETWGPNGVRHPVAQFEEKIRRLNKLCVCDRCHSAGYLGRMRNGEVISPGNPCTVSGCEGKLRRPRLFADSNSDWLDEKWPIGVFANFLNEIRLAPNIDVLLLTKRPENFHTRVFKECLKYFDGEASMTAFIDRWRMGIQPKNLWLGVSVENQAMADLRIPQLLKIPAAIRFLSCEPLLEEVHLGKAGGLWTDMNENIVPNGCVLGKCVDWVIVGGESGDKRRDCGVEAIVNVADQCRAAGVPVYVKQDCAFKSGEQGRIPDEIWKLKQFPSAEVSHKSH